MENFFSFNDKPLAFWMVQMLSEDVTEHSEAAHAIDAMVGMDNLEPFSEAVREIVQSDGLVPFGMTSTEYVHRLLSMQVFHGDIWQKYWTTIRDDDNSFIDQWIAEHGNAPEQLKKLMRRMCLKNIRREREHPFDFMPGICIGFLISPLGKEFLPAADMLRWMLRDKQHCGIATTIVYEMKDAGEIFFDDYLEIARNDSCALHNYSHHVGDMVRHSPEKIGRLLKLVDDSDPQMSLFAVAALGDCGSEAERLVSGVEDRLLRLSVESFDKLYGENAVPVNDRKQRNALESIFSYSTTSLGAVAESREAIQHFLKLLDTDLPKEPLKGIHSSGTNEYDWEFAVAPIQLVRGTLISSLKYFASFPEIVVPRLILLLTEFEEYDGDTYQYARVLDALAVYANFGVPEAKRESRHYDYSSDEHEYLFFNRFEPYFEGLPEILGNLLWEESDSDDEDQEPDLNDRIVQMLGRLGKISQSQLPRLEEAKNILLKRYGKKYFKYGEDEPEPSLLAAIRRIQGDQ